MAGKASSRRAHTRSAALTVVLCTAPLLAAGCWNATGNTDLQRELQVARDTIARQNDELAAQKATIDTLEKRVETIRAIRPEDLEKLVHPVKLEIDSLSGGYDTDGRPGDDGVVVYLRPLDDDGDALKVAGQIRIQLYDLAAPSARNLIAERVIPVDEARELWYGKLITQHYTVHCPWQHGPPRHSEITISASFVDYLTQRVISAQQSCTVKLPP